MSSFRVTKGSFVLPAALLEDGREYELSRYFAEHLPRNCARIERRTRNSIVTVFWTHIRFLGWFDEDGRGPDPTLSLD